MKKSIEKYVIFRQSQIWSVSTGRGLPVILCNGGPGCDDYLAPVAELLEEANCHVVRFEPRGCGRSSYDGQYDIDTSIADLDTIREAYQFRQAIIIGHSAGVDTALAYALENPKQTLGVIGISGGRIVNDREWSKVYKARRDAEGEDYGGKIFTADPKVNIIGNASWRSYIQRPNLLRELSITKVPFAFIYGSQDIRPSWPTQQLAHLIPNANYIEIKGAAHCIWLTHPQELKRELLGAIAFISHP